MVSQRKRGEEMWKELSWVVEKHGIDLGPSLCRVQPWFTQRLMFCRRLIDLINLSPSVLQSFDSLVVSFWESFDSLLLYSFVFLFFYPIVLNSNPNYADIRDD